MKLKRFYAKEDDIPKEQRALYSKSGDQWVLDAEDDPDAVEQRRKTAEFRDSNIALKRQLEELQAKVNAFDGLDPERLKQALGALQQIEDNDERELIKSGKIQEVIDRRTAKMREGYETQINAMKTAGQGMIEELTGLRGTVNNTRLAEAVNKAITTRKLKPLQTASADLNARFRGVFQFDEKGALVARDEKGNVRYNKKGEPMTVEDYAGDLVEEAPHLFEPSGGGGGAGGGGGGAHTPGVIRIPRGDSALATKHMADLATGKAVFVDN